MKQLLIVCAMFVAHGTTHAQVTAGMQHNQWEENSNAPHHKAIATPANMFVNVEMAVSDRTILFSDLPAMSKNIYAIITNAEGDFIKQGRITATENSMDIKKLHHGLYFITIMYKNESKKAFTLNL